jgi:hypothetical protein
MTVFVANANALELNGLTSLISGTLSSATVQATIRDAAGVVQVGAGWPAFPLTVPAVVGQPGNYRVVFDDAVPWVGGKTYVATITVDGGEGTWEHRFRPQVRDF